MQACRTQFGLSSTTPGILRPSPVQECHNAVKIEVSSPAPRDSLAARPISDQHSKRRRSKYHLGKYQPELETRYRGIIRAGNSFPSIVRVRKVEGYPSCWNEQGTLHYTGCCEAGWVSTATVSRVTKWLGQSFFQDGGEGLGRRFTTAVSSQRAGRAIGPRERWHAENAQCSAACNRRHESATVPCFRSPRTRKTVSAR